MKWDNEKSGFESVAGPVLDTLALVSVLVVLAGAVLGAVGVPLAVRAYFSVAALFFDLVFTFEFFALSIAARKPAGVIGGLSSAVPLLLVSGPFLYGWAMGDFGSAAVRSFAFSSRPLGGLSVVAALRLLRVIRLDSLRRLYAPAGPAAEGGPRAPGRLAAIAGLAVVMLGAIASDALILPGYEAAIKARRETAVTAILEADGPAARVAAARASGALALRVDGADLLAARDAAALSDYAHVARPPAEAWFDAREEARARGLSETIAALASLAAAAAYATLAVSGRRTGRGATAAAGAGPNGRPADEPTGDEELAGILGKRR